MDEVHAQAFDGMFGLACTGARSNIGSIFSLDFERDAEQPSTRLLVWFGDWYLTDQDHQVANSGSERTEIVSAIESLVGSTIERFGVHEESGRMRVWFSDGRTLTVHPSTYNPTAPWWILYDEGGRPVVEVGPGTPKFRTPEPS